MSKKGRIFLSLLLATLVLLAIVTSAEHVRRHNAPDSAASEEGSLDQ